MVTVKDIGDTIDLPQVPQSNLTSFFQASGASFLGRHAAERTTKSREVFVERHIKSNEGLFESLESWKSNPPSIYFAFYKLHKMWNSL